MLVYPSLQLSSSYVSKHKLTNQHTETWIFTPVGLYKKDSNGYLKATVNEVRSNHIDIGGVQYHCVDKSLFCIQDNQYAKSHSCPFVSKSYLVQSYKINSETQLIVKQTIGKVNEKLVLFKFKSVAYENNPKLLKSLLNKVLIDTEYDTVNS